VEGSGRGLGGGGTEKRGRGVWGGDGRRRRGEGVERLGWNYEEREGVGERGGREGGGAKRGG